MRLRASAFGLRRSFDYFTARLGFAVPLRAVGCPVDAAGLRPVDSWGRLSPHQLGWLKAEDQRQKRRTGVSDPHGLSFPSGYLFRCASSFYVFGEHFCGVDGDEGSAAAG